MGGYMAPEVAQGVSYDMRCDLWSLGVITYKALSGSLPYPCNEASQEHPPKLELSESWSPEAREFVGRLLTVDFKERPSASMALEMPFLHCSRPPEYGKVLSDQTVTELSELAKASPALKALALIAGRFLNSNTVPRMRERRAEFLLL